MTNEEYLAHRRNAFTRDGTWNADYLSGLPASFWAQWIERRLRGDDPPYGKDELPDTAHGLFLRLVDDAPHLRLDLNPCREGAAAFLASLQVLPENIEPDHLLLNALDLTGSLRVRNDDALTCLRNWINEHSLLERSTRPLELHRAALYALAAAQQRGHPEDESIWMEWLSPRSDGDPERAMFFLPAAFSGLALSRAQVPVELLDLLKRFKAEKEAGRRLRISSAVLALWVDRVSRADHVRSELWATMAQSETPEADWEIIVRCAHRMWPAVSPWSEMTEVLGKPGSAGNVSPMHVPGGISSLWDVDANVRKDSDFKVAG